MGRSGQACPIEHLVAFGVFAAVHRFLADERRHRLLQLRLDDLRAIVANGVNEEALTVRKEQRQCIEEMADVRAFVVPVADALGRQLEMQVAAGGHDDSGDGSSSFDGRHGFLHDCYSYKCNYMKWHNQAVGVAAHGQRAMSICRDDFRMSIQITVLKGNTSISSASIAAVVRWR